MSAAVRFLVVLEAFGLAGMPLAARALGRLPGAGLGLGRVLALLLAGWLVWLAGSLGVPNGSGLVLGAAAAVVLGAVAAWRLGGRAPGAEADPFRRRLLIAAESLFVVAFLGGALWASYAPDVWGTEKPMDMMLINATLVSDGFPPHDPWLSGEQLNYYYLGQLMLGMLVRLTDVEPTQGYNLALAAVFALMVTTMFTIGATLAEAARRQGLPVRTPLGTGAVAVVLVALMGNLRGGWEAITHDGPLREFAWFDASRVVTDTINEFPAFSFTVGDLHAHLVAVPLSLLALGFIVQAGLHGPPSLRPGAGWWETLCAALAVGILYAVNAWSWPVLAGLLVLAVVLWGRSAEAAGRRLRALAWAAGVLALGLLLVLPFLLEFDPNSSGFGVVPTVRREEVGTFFGHHLVMYGALLWLLAAPFGARLRAARHPGRIIVGAVAVGIVAVSVLASSRLGGAAVAAVLAVAALVAALSPRAATVERLLWGLTAAALALLAGAEVVYVRDEFAGTEFVRMNTVFKLGYQAWILLALAGALALAVSRRWLPRLPRLAWQAAAVALVGVSLAYPIAATVARTGGFAEGPSLDGRAWLARSAPGDVGAIDWLREHAPGDAVLLEAVGDDYSPLGNARMSSYTGRQAVLGWQGHELQWSHDVGTRRDDVGVMYTTGDAATARGLLERYGVDFAVLGPLERTFYGTSEVLETLGRKVFDRDGTAIYAFGGGGGGGDGEGDG